MGELIPFPGVDVDLGESAKQASPSSNVRAFVRRPDPRVIPPLVINARVVDPKSWVDLLDQAREHHEQTQKRKLSLVELGDARVRGIQNCERCDGRVVAHEGEWWNATFGELHKNVCGNPFYKD